MKGKTTSCAVVLMSLLITACARELQPSLPAYMDSKHLPAPTAQSFPHCLNYGCRTYKNVMLNERDWNAILKNFGRPARDGAQEREKIAKTIPAFERIVGAAAGTGNDAGGSFTKTGEGQLDCVDESTNTTVYLELLSQKGLIRFHEIGQPQVRYPILSGRGWMHQTAVIRDLTDRSEWAVDSWFSDNGQPISIVPLEGWHNGWHPAD